jgi:fibrillarin-like rRNA methylase
MSPECFAAYEDKLARELHRRDLIVINLERLLEALEKSIADIKDKRETTPYVSVSDACDSLLRSFSDEKERVERRIEDHLYSIAPSATTLMGHRILARMLAHAGSFRALAFMPASRLQVLGAEKGLFTSKSPKHGYIFQHPEVKGAAREDRGRSARRLACALALALRKDFFSAWQESMHTDERLKPGRARANERSKLFYLFELHPELAEWFRGRVLYLGAGSGSTARRLARISEMLYCVEVAPLPFSSLMEVAKRERRNNICPMLEDAGCPERYASMVRGADMLYQDVTQRTQVEMFLNNMSFFSVKRGVLMVKASSIDARRPAEEVFAECRGRLAGAGYSAELVDLREEFRNHAALIAEKL